MADADQSGNNNNLESTQEPEEKSPSDGEELLQRVRNLMRRVTAARSSPHPRFLHTLAAIIEEEESRSDKDVGHSTSSTSRSNHAGKLVSLIRDNDDFFELLSSKLLVESRHSVAVKAGAARLLLACLSCGMYPDVFDEAVVSNIKQWVIEDAPKSTSDGVSSKKPGASKAKGIVSTDWDMLRTCSLGLLGLALTAGGSIIEEVLATGVAGKLMHYLRIRVLKDTKDWAGSEHKSSGSSAVKIRDDVKPRARQPSEATAHLEIAQVGNEVTEGGDKLVERETLLEKSFAAYDADDDGDEKCQRRETREGKSRIVDSSCTNLIGKDGTLDDTIRGEPSKRKGDARDRGSCKFKGKAKISDGMNDSERDVSTPGGGARRCGTYERTKSFKLNDSEKIATENFLAPSVEGASTCDSVLVTDGDEDANDQYGSIIVDGVDVSAAVKKAARAAETEARNAQASIEAIQAAGEAAIDLVKAAALESLKQSLDKEAALAAAMSAAVSVEDAGAATWAIRKNLLTSNQSKDDCDEEEVDLDFSELRDCALSHEALGSLRERFSVQCLQRLGEYQEVLGPVLHERGVDVCLTLLQRESAAAVFTKPKAMLPDVLKLICALAAHRKFSALFVDRGGVQLILAAPRNAQTYTGISLCLFAFASIQGVMERVCTAPTEVVNEVVSLALHVLECVQDSARKNAVFFFGASFVFRAILDSFDAQDGLRKMISLLQNAVALRSGGNTGLPGTLPTSRADRAASAEVLTSSEKQIAYHTCVALRQYFRARLLILVDTIRPYRGRNGMRIFPSGRAAYKPLDISNEAMESLILQIQRDRKLGPAFVRARWPMLEKFISFSGHLILLELTQVGPGERYLHDIAQHSLGVLQIVTLMPFSRKPIISSTLSNDRSSMSVLLDAANATVFSEPEVIQAALLVLVNLVCPPPSLSSRLNQQSSSSQMSQQQITSSEVRERHGKGDGLAEKSVMERSSQAASGLIEGREGVNKGDEKVGALNNTCGPISPAAALVGDRRISLGSVAGGPGIAAYIEQGYRQARDAVRANNGIKVLLHLLYSRPVLPPSSLDCIRALACRVLLGLARDDAIAHILTKLQVGKLLAELLRDGGSHFGRTAAASSGGEQGRWHTELGQVSMELMAMVTNAGRAGTLVTSDAAAPTLRRIERAAIAAATPINYPSRELLQLIHEHLVLSGLSNSASTLLKEAQLAPLPSLAMQGLTVSQSNAVEPIQEAIQWPIGRISGGFMIGSLKAFNRKDESKFRADHVQGSALKKTPICSLISQRPPQSSPFLGKKPACLQVENRDSSMETTDKDEGFRICGGRLGDLDYGEALRSSICVSKLSSKRKFLERESTFTPNKRLATSDLEGMLSTYKSPVNLKNFHTHSNSSLPHEQGPLDRLEKPQLELLHNDDDDLGRPLQVPSATPKTSVSSHVNLHLEPQPVQVERATLDSLVVQYLKHQHRQCPAPITTLPPLSLFHPHVCPEPSRASYAPYNLAGRLVSREVMPPYGGTHGRRRNKHFIYSRFRPWRQCRDERTLLTSSTFLGTTFRLAAGSHGGEIRLFDCHSGDVLETHTCHQSPITLLQSSPQTIGSSIESTGSQPVHLLLSSGSFDVRLWNSSMLGEIPLFSFDGCKAARFNNKGDVFAAISSNTQKEVLLYDVQTGQRQQKLSDPSYSAGVPRGSAQCITHFSPSDTLLLWNGVLWDHRLARSVHRFDQFTDYGGGGFHPAGNEVVINSEVWDLRTFKLLRSVPSLDQTVIKFNATGDVIYAILRRNLDDITSAIHPRRNRHPLFAAFRTMDAFDYTDIATTSVDRCVLDLATEPTDSLISVVALDGHEEMDALAKLYEVGRRKPTEDDSDPDDGVETDDEEDSLAEEEAVEEDALHLDADDSDLDGSNNDGSGDEAEEDTHEDDEDEAVEVDGSVVEIITDGSEGELQLSFSSEDEGSFGDYDDEDDDDFNDIFEVFL
ncbi:hypothetical protein GOP47_0013585 [Adiantum capillus-veneris]|uniref:LisH domain-containing protein n=1 Tax=Adiantum capillus-veneris TaxID=13818 RepID=A0A9D4ZDI9_ADICA|nr:hypothetical protein GOP47_0013585 [Adiantum capillus-veneris]